MAGNLTMQSAEGATYVHWGVAAALAVVALLLIPMCLRSNENMQGGLTYDQELQILQQMNPSANWSAVTQVHDDAAIAALQGTALDYPQIQNNPDDFFTMWNALTPTQQTEAARLVSQAARANQRAGFSTRGSPPAFFGPTVDLRDRSWTPKEYDNTVDEMLLDRLNKLREERGQQPVTEADAKKLEGFGNADGAFSDDRLVSALDGM